MTLRIYLAAVIMLGLVSCNTSGDSLGCIDESKIDPDAICTQLYAPVCGCDGLTYGNECVARSKGVTRWEEGECMGVIDSSAMQ